MEQKKHLPGENWRKMQGLSTNGGLFDVDDASGWVFRDPPQVKICLLWHLAAPVVACTFHVPYYRGFQNTLLCKSISIYEKAPIIHFLKVTALLYPVTSLFHTSAHICKKNQCSTAWLNQGHLILKILIANTIT
jgi:hypothetical protein